MSQRKHLEEFDYLRGIAIIAVVIIHCTGSHWWKGTVNELNFLVLANSFFFKFSSFAVPVFIFISGFILTYNYDEEVPIREFYIKRIKYILYPYVIFSFIYLLYYLINGSLFLNKDLLLIAFKLFSASMAFHLWFIALIIQFYLLFPHILTYCFSVKNEKLVLACSLMVSLLCSLVMIFFQSVFKVSIDGNFHKLLDLIGDRIFLPYLFYFILGMHFCRKADFIKRHILNINIIFLFFTLIICAIFRMQIYLKRIYTDKVSDFVFLTDLTDCILWYIASSFAIIFFYRIALVCLDNRFTFLSILKKIGSYSFGIFLIHGLFLGIFGLLLTKLSIKKDSMLFYFFLFSLTISFSYYSTILISFSRCGKYIVGIKSRGN